MSSLTWPLPHHIQATAPRQGEKDQGGPSLGEVSMETKRQKTLAFLMGELGALQVRHTKRWPIGRTYTPRGIDITVFPLMDLKPYDAEQYPHVSRLSRG